MRRLAELFVLITAASLTLPGQAAVSVTIQTQFNGLNTIVDGAISNQAQQASWVPGSSHSIGVLSPQLSCGVKYTFVSWNIGGSQNQTVTASAANTVYVANFSREYALDLQATPTQGGTVTASVTSPTTYYAAGTTLLITATPASGYVFVGWSGDYVGNTNPLPVSMDGYRTVAAVFAKAGVVMATIMTNPPGLSVIVDGAVMSTPASLNWPPSTQHTLAVANVVPGSDSTRYAFQSWSDGLPATHPVSQPAAPTIYTANFITQVPLTLQSSPANAGTVVPAPALDGSWAVQSSSVRLTAMPAAGFQFDRWTGDLVSRENPVTVTMEAARSATAIFVPATNCTAGFDRTAASVPAVGDIVKAAVLAGSQCSWSATADVSWISFASGASGTGNGILRFTVQPNSGLQPRTGNVQLSASAVIRVTQAANSCVFLLGTQGYTAASSGGSSQTVVSGLPSCEWSAATASGWITISPKTGPGGATMNFTIAANPGQLRTGSIVVDGQTLQILQKSANPVVPSYTDVALADVFFDYIQMLSQNLSGAGCSLTQFCPGAPTTRGQMAQWVIAALYGDSFAYTFTPYFNDVPASHPQFKYIQKMRDLGITSGCDAAKYCSDEAVTRGQMAAFLVRARLGLSSAQTFAHPALVSFTDVSATHLFFPFVQKLRELGITGGCTETGYCPDATTTRGQMAVFLMRAFFTP